MDDSEEYIKELGKRLKQIRTAKNMTQLDVASLCNIEESAYRRIENGKTNPTIKTLFTISQSFDVSIGDLLPK